MKQGNKAGLGLAIVPLLGIAAFLQSKIDPQRAQYAPGDRNASAASKVLPIEFALGAMTGFREAIAGLLWVRVDQFFHEGDYGAITPLIRIITWLDPHNTDVYQTGAWHMDYNFTDESQRSDRRYIPLAIALMREGIANNADNPDMYADLAFTHYFRKIADFHKSQEYFAQGQDAMLRVEAASKANPGDAGLKAEAQKAALDVTTTGHGLAHAYEALGMIPEAEAQWQWCITHHQENLANGYGSQFGEKSSLQVAQRILHEMQMRSNYRKDLYKDPHDMQFSAQLKRIAPREFVLSGTMNVEGAQGFVLETGKKTWAPTDGARVEVRLQDEGYKMKELPSFSLNSLHLAETTTIMQDAASVRKGTYTKKLDMSQDPNIYSFSAPTYEVIVWFNPCNPNDSPPQVQDRIGWLGEGMTDKKYLDTTGVVPGDTTEPITGLRQIKKVFKLTREDILGQGEKVFN